MPSSTPFRPPSTLSSGTSSPPTFQAPPDDLFFGEWHMQRTSNSHWKDKKNVRMSYTPAHSDAFIAQSKKTSATTTISGSNMPVENETGVFAWQMKGLLRFIGAKWEILAWKASEDGRPAWMVTYAHKTIFTAAAVDVSCKPKGGISEVDMREIEGLLAGVQDAGFQKTVKEMFDVEQD
ncbi:hypothetical protein N0V90_000520 [Kalmusia sp. IMI 367209]|nr:hypothetical protein N0V90_000520 [Kalmusia sp. IMI 367209]